MKSKVFLTIAAIGLFTFAANAAEIIVPAAGTGAGANASQWKSDLFLHNIGPRAVAAVATLHIGTDVHGPVAVSIPAKNTRQYTDVVKTLFNVPSGTGAIVLELTDRDAKFLAVNSRTYNVLGGVEYGQDIPAVRAENTAAAGTVAVMTNPATSVNDRFNFGVYNVEATTIRWDLVRADGTLAASTEVSYDAEEHAQYNGGIFSLLGATEARLGDAVYARVLGGKAVVYGSSINDTGDPTFVPSSLVTEEVLLAFGIDIDEDGTIDISDEDGDGILDASIEVVTSLFPAYFRVVVENDLGEPVTLEVVESQAVAEFRDANGTLRVTAPGELKKSEGTIVLRATSASGATTLLTIPVRFK